jgi:ribonuclease HI
MFPLPKITEKVKRRRPFHNREKQPIDIWINSSHSDNSNVGGWAFIITDYQREKSNYGAKDEVEENEMILYALLNAIKGIQVWSNIKVTIYSEHEYVEHIFTRWIIGWEKSNYKNKKNVHLIRNIWMLIRDKEDVKFKTIANSGSEYFHRTKTMAQNEMISLEHELKFKHQNERVAFKDPQ